MALPASITIVEDDTGMCDAIAGLLTVAGYRTVAFASAEALLASDQAICCRCLVLDLGLPGLSGLGLLWLLRNGGIEPPCIFISGDDALLARARSEHPDAVAYLCKPFDGRVLLDAVARAAGPGGALN